METLTKGFQKPAKPDSGAKFFPALEENIQQLNDHTHNGVDSNKLSGIAAVAITTQDLASADWVASGSEYRQLVTLPTALTASVPTGAGLGYDDVAMQFRLSTGEIFFPTVEKVSATTFYLYINDATQAVRILYAT